MKFFTSAEFMNALWLSLRVAVIVVALSTVIGAMCALAIARGKLPGARLLTTLFLSPLMLPAILTGLALFQVFMLPGIGRPVWGLVAGHTLVAVPYVLRTTLAVLQNFDRRVEEAAAMLGAPPARVFFEVTLPLIRPGVIAGGIFGLHRFVRPASDLAVPRGAGRRDLAGRAAQLHPLRPRWSDRRCLDGVDRARALRRSAARTHHRPARLCPDFESKGETDMTKWKLSRRTFLQAPAARRSSRYRRTRDPACADSDVLKTTAWGGK